MYPVPTAVGVEVVFVSKEPYESSSWSQVSLETRLLQITWLATAIKYKPLHHLVLQDEKSLHHQAVSNLVEIVVLWQTGDNRLNLISTFCKR